MDVAPPVVGGVQGGHGEANLRLGAVRALCRNAPPHQGRPCCHRTFMEHRLGRMHAHQAIAEWPIDLRDVLERLTTTRGGGIPRDVSHRRRRGGTPPPPWTPPLPPLPPLPMFEADSKHFCFGAFAPKRI